MRERHFMLVTKNSDYCVNSRYFLVSLGYIKIRITSIKKSLEKEKLGWKKHKQTTSYLLGSNPLLFCCTAKTLITFSLCVPKLTPSVIKVTKYL